MNFSDNSFDALIINKCLMSVLNNENLCRGRNFERSNVERPIFPNLKIVNVKSYEKFSSSIFLFTNFFFHFFQIITQII